MPYPGAPPPSPYRAPGPSLTASLVVGAIGLVIGIASAIAIAIPLLGTFTSSSYVVPGDLHLHLRHARYTVYQHSGTRSAFGSTRNDAQAIEIRPGELSVVGSDGTLVPVSFDSSTETVTRGSDVYSGALEFSPPAGGDYRLRFTNSTRTSVIVARSLTDAIDSALVWFGTGALGGAVLIAGVIMLIVGTTRRSRAKRAMYGGWGYPGWPPPPPQYPPAPPSDPWAPRG
jgi:hypothetical protein